LNIVPLIARYTYRLQINVSYRLVLFAESRRREWYVFLVGSRSHSVSPLLYLLIP